MMTCVEGLLLVLTGEIDKPMEFRRVGQFKSDDDVGLYQKLVTERKGDEISLTIV